MRFRFLALIAVAVAALVGCAGEAIEPGGSPTTTVPPAPTVSTVDLRIVIGTNEYPDEFTASLVCGDRADATGYLGERGSEACAFLVSSDDARSLLVDGAAPNRVCTEVYGGGEVARIDGTIGDTAISRTIDRANGCGIADWDLLQPILVEPYDLARREACSGAGVPSADESPQANLPPAVAEVRRHLMALARSCDFEALGELALADGTNYSFGAAGDPAGLWRMQEDRGDTPMAALVQVLYFPPDVREIEGIRYYVWPAVAALDDWTDATDLQRRQLADVFGDEALADWDAFGGYIGYRVGITEAGDWAYFVAGD